LLGRVRLDIAGLDSLIARYREVAANWSTIARPAMPDVARYLRESIEDEARRHAARSAVSVELRPEGGVHRLVKLIKEDVTSSTAGVRLDIAGGKLLHEGGTTAAGSMIPGKAVPARPFVVVRQDARERSLRRIHEELLATLEGRA
jgi:hypothetical protein